MLTTKFLILQALILSSLSGFTQAVKADLDSLFDLYDRNKSLMGCLAISKNGSIIYSKAIGYAVYNEKKQIASTENTKYRIGSISKTFASTILFQLIEEGKINLSDHLDQYFPQFPNAKIITIENLMNHTSGIRNFTTIKHKQCGRSHDEMLKFIGNKSLKFPPGSKTAYSNANYVILGYIIEKITHQPYGEVLNERIINKIRLTNTYYGLTDGFHDDESLPYSFKKSWKQEHQTHLSIPGASGAIISTPVDLVRFIEALFSYKLISANSLHKMKTITDSYGMGMMEFAFYTKKALGQIGGIDTYQSVLAYFPSDSLAIAFCSNGQASSVRDILLDALNIYYGKLYENPEFKLLSISTKPKGLDTYTGIYSNKTIPLTIMISKHHEELTAQPTGLPPYAPRPIGSKKFKCDEIGATVRFNKVKNRFTLKKGSMVYDLFREN